VIKTGLRQNGEIPLPSC